MNKKHKLFLYIFCFVISVFGISESAIADQSASNNMKLQVKQAFISVYGATHDNLLKLDYVLVPEKETSPMPNNQIGGRFDFSIVGEKSVELGPISYSKTGIYKYYVEHISTDIKDYEYSKIVYDIEVYVHYNEVSELEAIVVIYNDKKEKAEHLFYEHRYSARPYLTPTPGGRPTTKPTIKPTIRPTRELEPTSIVKPTTIDISTNGVRVSAEDTGDDNRTVIYMMIFVIALCIFVRIIIFYRRKGAED